jgi:hypothetical protein
MHISSSGNMLRTITKDLSIRWEETKHSWRDAKSAEFEQKYLLELFGSVERAVGYFDQLDTLVTRIRKDCE